MLSLESRCQIMAAEGQKKLRGIARVGISSLRFFPHRDQYNRNTDVKKVAALQRIFRVNGCDRLNQRHRIYATVSAEDLRAALAYSKLQLEDLQDAAFPPVLTFPPGMYAYCAQGRSRVHAFMQSKEASWKENQWWTIEIYQSRTAAPQTS